MKYFNVVAVALLLIVSPGLSAFADNQSDIEYRYKEEKARLELQLQWLEKDREIAIRDQNTALVNKRDQDMAYIKKELKEKDYAKAKELAAKQKEKANKDAEEQAYKKEREKANRNAEKQAYIRRLQKERVSALSRRDIDSLEIIDDELRSLGLEVHYYRRWYEMGERK
jgi:hypothetical protein